MLKFNNKALGIIFSLILSFFSFNVYADTFVVKLESITKIKASESSGDELYFAATEFSSHGDASHYRVPAYPVRWLSAELEKVTDTILWKGDVVNGESIQLQLSLIEMDVYPWNVDDLVGTTKLKIKNEGGVIRCDWLKGSNQTIAYSAFNKVTRNYLFDRDGAVYSVVITLAKK